MASLKEIKNRVSSVRSTLKITSAMKMVASAKLRKAQQAAEAMRPYEAALHGILLHAGGAVSLDSSHMGSPSGTVALLALSSNSSLCGAFNANVIRTLRARVAELEADGKEVVVYCIGRKVSEAMRRDGRPSPFDGKGLAGAADYDGVSALARSLAEAYVDGRYERVELVYNHFVSTSSQQTLVETYLPFSMEADGQPASGDADGYIVEPDRESLLKSLLPMVLRLKLYAVLLDSTAAEHAARTVAMQTATDNGEEMLGELTLQYNKGRQQKITSEILDLAGGAQEQ